MIATHRRFLELSAASIDFELSRSEHQALEAHLAACETCRRDVARLRGDARTIAAMPPRPRTIATGLVRGYGRVDRRPVLRLVFIAAMLALLAAGLVTVGSELLRRVHTVALPDASPQATQRPPLGTWQAAAPLNVARSLHTSTLLPDGRVLVVGGAAGLTSIGSAEIYDPALGGWSLAPDMAETRSSQVAYPFFDESVIVAGGYRSVVGGEVVGSIEAFVDGNWNVTQQLADARADFAVVFQASRALAFIGGHGSDGRALASMEILDLDTDAVMRDAAPMASPRAFHTATTLFDLRILVAGGVDNDGIPLATAELFDPATGQWKTVAPMHEPRAYHTAVRLNDDRVLVAGGEDASGKALDTAELYDAKTDTWTVVPMLEARERHGATRFAGSTVLIVGGERDGTSLSTTEVFDPVTNSWMAGPELRQARSYVSLVRLKTGAVMVTGGAWESSSALADVEILDPLARP